MHMIANGSRDADATRRTFGLKPCRHIHCVTMQISAVCNRVANVDPDAKAYGSIGRLVTVIVGHPLLHLHGAPYRPIDAVEHDQQGIAASLDDPTTMLPMVGSISSLRRARSRWSVPWSSSPIRRV